MAGIYAPIKSMVSSPMGTASVQSLPRAGLLLYLGRPNLEAADVPLGDDTEIGDDTIIRWMFLLPADADIRAATGWVSGVGNIFYDAAGDPVAVFASEIAAWSSINQWNVLFHLVSADTETGRLAIYAQDTALAILNKALKVLREDQIDVSPSAFFNGMDTTGKTSYTGGPTYAPDHLGVLRSPGSNRWAVQGMRLATTVADGAVLGPEMVTNAADRDFSSDTGFWTKETGSSISGGKVVFTNVGLNLGIYKLAFCTVGKIYAVSYDLTITSGSVSSWAGNNTAAFLPVRTSNGTYTDLITCTTTNFIEIGSKTAGTNATIDNVSIKEVIPIYINTDESGNAILPSTPQKTVTYSTDWTAKTFAETFDRFDTSDPLKAPGWLCEGVRTNKVACRKSNPIDTSGLTKSGDAAAVLSVVDDTAALTAAGLIGLCILGKVYKLDNSAGTTEARILSGASVAGANSISAYVKGGTGKIGALGSAAHLTAFAASGIYIRVKSENKTLVDGNQFDLRVDAGAVVYFILPQLEEGAFCTSPICKLKDGTDPLTAITRAATVPSFPTAGKIPVNNFAIRMIVVPRASGQSSAYCFGTYIDSNNYTAIIINPTSVTIRKMVSGISNDASVSITHANRIPLDLILYSSPATGIQVAGRAFTSSWGLFTDGAINSTTAAKANAQIASTYQLGALNGSVQFTGNISLFDCVPIPTGIIDPMAWAKTHWGVA